MLILTRRANESIILSLSDEIDPTTPIGEIFSQPIEITQLGSKGNQVRLGITASSSFTILREELRTQV